MAHVDGVAQVEVVDDRRLRIHLIQPVATLMTDLEQGIISRAAAGKDMRFYTRLAESAPATAFIAQAVNQTYQLANIMGHGERYMPTLPGILAELNGCTIRKLD